ncbi:transcription termination factor NusA [Weissella ceti]|uniref:Transcription termination/antitermination protein NusA n=1 Tax=Weissella ceti TaxID=759620 RepID=A0ABT3E3I0_9LACO|nr:transcription termination factor NusA [Weissella ceti]MCW0952809.1 transcription termination factor NusA [Weissella ceti]QVK12507.1 transcription termination/antitermination protein NusA [Weissella ceti]
MSKEMLNALNILETEKGIKKEVLVAAIEEALTKAYEKHYDESSNVEVVFDQKKGNVKVYSVMKVVEDIYEPYEEITLEQALEVNKGYEIGDDVKFEVTPSDFGRLAAQTAKQIIMQKVREAERNIVYDNFIKHDGEMLTGVVERQDPRHQYVILPGNQEAAMEQNDQMPNEKYVMGEQIKVLVSRVQNEKKGPQVFVSRTAPGLVKRLFEAEVPEVFDGTVEIKAIAREAGDRAKVAVYSHNENLDAVGTMVGQRGQRVQAIVNELSGENMDIVEWTEDPAQFIKNALNPAEVIDVIFDPSDERAATVIVPDYQLSLAIGKRGQNARLAARLTNFKIDIKPESERAAVVENINNPAPAAVEEDVFADVENDVFGD